MITESNDCNKILKLVKKKLYVIFKCYRGPKSHCSYPTNKVQSEGINKLNHTGAICMHTFTHLNELKINAEFEQLE